MESHMAGIQWSFQVGLVALPSWAQSQPILEVVATTAGIEVVVHELLFMTEVSLQILFLLNLAQQKSTACCWSLQPHRLSQAQQTARHICINASNSAHVTHVRLSTCFLTRCGAEVAAAQAWRQPSDDFDEEFLKVAGEAFKQNIESTEGAKAQVSLDTLRAWVPLSGERISQHALVSALLALEVLVTGSLPGAMLTQVRMHSSGIYVLPDLRHLARR